MEEEIEDLIAVQEQKNKEYKQKQFDELRTPSGLKAFISAKIGKFTHKLMTKKTYQGVAIVLFVYITLAGIYYMFSNLFSIQTVIVIALCFIWIHWIKIKMFFLYIKEKLKNVFNKRK